MNIQEILTILVPTLALLGWVYSRIDKRFDSIMNELKEMRKDIQSLDTRVSRIEGFLAGPTHWEPKIIQKEEEK